MRSFSFLRQVLLVLFALTLAGQALAEVKKRSAMP